MFRKVVLTTIILSLLVVSCRPTVSPTQPGNYKREAISQEDLPEPVQALASQVLFQTESQGPVVVSQAMVIAQTNKEGLVAYEDPSLGFTVPVRVTDSRGDPIPEINVAYSSNGSEVSILVSDSEGKYAPEIVNLTREELLSKANLSFPQVVDELFGVTAAEAAPERILQLVAAIVVVLVVVTKAVDIYLAANDVQEVLLSRDQVVGYASGNEYVCRSPEYFSSRAGLTLDLILVWVPNPAGRGGKMVMTWAGNLLGIEIKIIADRMIVDEPILFRRHFYTPEKQDLLIYHAANVSPEMSFDTFEVLEPIQEVVGRCVFVPDLNLVRVFEAKAILAENGISPEYYEIQCHPGPISCDDQFVVYQDPQAERGTLVGAERQMLPLLMGENGTPMKMLYLFAEPSLEVFPTPEPTQAVAPTRRVPSGTTQYVVQPGETLFEIAERFCVNINELLAANPAIQESGTVFAGETLTIPVFEGESCGAAQPAPVCGNGILEPGEECDRSDLGFVIGCADFVNYLGGELSCNADCTFNLSGCVQRCVCGNNVRESGEECDGSDFGFVTGCADLDFTGGTLYCNSSCVFDTSGCTR